MGEISELITVVDQQNKEIGAAPLETVLRRRYIHRVIWGVVSTADGDVLVRKRSQKAAIHPSRLDVGVAATVPAGTEVGHVTHTSFLRQAGLVLDNHTVEYSDAKYHETALDLDPMPPLARVMRHQFATVVRITAYPDDVQSEKISEPLWMRPEEIRSLARNKPEQITPELQVVATEYL